MAKILYGRPVAESIYKTIDSRVSELADREARYAVASVRVGDGPDDVAYERSIAKACKLHGIDFSSSVLPIDAQTRDVVSEVERANSNDSIDGCLVFNPMPDHIDGQAVCNAIAPLKDIDCASDASLGDVLLGKSGAFAPATAEAVIRICDFYDIGLTGASVVIVGRSRVIGKPVGMLALDRDATVTFCHSGTRELESVTKGADIVVCAIGRPRYFKAGYFRPGQTVIDVGMSVDKDGSLCGDVAVDEVENMVGAITPVPGGVGAVTTSVLLEHVTRGFRKLAERS